MYHKVERVDDLMYKGCEPHWHCIQCDDYWPFHCFTDKQLEKMTCNVINSNTVETKVEEFKNDKEELEAYRKTGLLPNEIMKLVNHHKSYAIDVGDTVYIITRYIKWEAYEVVKCTVDRKTIKKKFVITVSGSYSNGKRYVGNFSEGSIGKTLFISEDLAKDACNRKNLSLGLA